MGFQPLLFFAPGEEAVFVFSPHPESHAIILQHYGNWPAVTAPGLPVGEDPELICFGGHQLDGPAHY